jgi:hypothetical protein
LITRKLTVQNEQRIYDIKIETLKEGIRKESERNLTGRGQPCIIKNIYDQNYKLRLINDDYYFDNCSSDYWEP